MHWPHPSKILQEICFVSESYPGSSKIPQRHQYPEFYVDQEKCDQDYYNLKLKLQFLLRPFVTQNIYDMAKLSLSFPPLAHLVVQLLQGKAPRLWEGINM
ncbi:hypothetical protein ES703_90773 [subsurface metagenome]